MTYSSPLKIFTEDQLENLSASNLLRVKKEMLLQFQLSDDITAEFNGHSIDKNELLQIFETLKGDLDLHVAIAKNKPLLQFLSEEKLLFFSDKESQSQVLKDDVFKDQINRLIVNKLKKLLPKLIMSFKSNVQYRIREIQKYTRELDWELNDIAYSEAHLIIKDFVDTAVSKFHEPFASYNGLKFDDELKEYVQKPLNDYFDDLPSSFESVAREYGIWCNNSIVVEAVNRENDLDKFPNNSLRVLRDAALIAANYHNREGNLRIARLADKSIYKEIQGSGFNVRSLWYVPLIFIFFLRIMAFDGCESNSNSYNYKDFDFSTIQRSISENLISQEAKEKVKSLVGDGYLNNESEQVSIKELGNTTEITLKVNVFPTLEKSLSHYIPVDFKNKYLDQPHQFKLKFIHKDFEDIIVNHTFDYAPNSIYANYGYKAKMDTSGNKNKLLVERTNYADYKYKGVISLINPDKFFDGKTTFRKATFEITYDLANRVYTVYRNNEQTVLKLDRDEISNILIGGSEYTRDTIRYATIITNLNAISNKYLSEGNKYSIEDIYTYNFDSFGSGFKVNPINFTNSNLNYRFTSEADNISVCSVYNNTNALRYLYNADGALFGMQMVNPFPMRNIYERVVVYNAN